RRIMRMNLASAIVTVFLCAGCGGSSTPVPAADGGPARVDGGPIPTADGGLPGDDGGAGDDGGTTVDDGGTTAEDGGTTGDCGADPAAAGATRFECANGVISPALVSLHDHLNWANAPPVDHDGIRYNHRNDWRGGKRGYTRLRNAGGDSGEASQAWGELRFLL